MFTKQTLMVAYRQFLCAERLLPQQVVLSAGGACVMHGVRESTQNLDVDVPLKDYQRLMYLDRYLVKVFILPDCEGAASVSIEYGGGLSLHRSDGWSDTVIVDGVCCLSIGALIAQKRRLNRSKDQADIQALDKLMFTVQ